MNEDALRFLTPRWIPISERLPPKGERVLATDGKEICCAEIYENSKDNTIYCSCERRSECIGYHATHWMCLPEKPE